MKKQELSDFINTKVTSYREYRLKYAQIIINDRTLFKPLLEISFATSDTASIKASWVLDFVIREKQEYLYPYFDFFTAKIGSVTHDSIARPMAKICELLALNYVSTKNIELKKSLSKKHIDKIIETGFDWLISEQKVAVKVYAMEALFWFGKEYDWVHAALQKILEQEIIYGSAAYKSRGKKILLLIKKHQKNS